MTMKRKSWQDYQKEIADDHYYYARSCIRQNFFPGSEKLFIDMLRNDLGKDLSDDPKHSSCTGIGYHSDIVPLETIMTVVARQFALHGLQGPPERLRLLRAQMEQRGQLVRQQRHVHRLHLPDLPRRAVPLLRQLGRFPAGRRQSSGVALI